jgi:hypothetical protein
LYETVTGTTTYPYSSVTSTCRGSGETKSAKVGYDDYGAVVDIDATTQIAGVQTTRDGAFDALFYTA